MPRWHVWAPLCISKTAPMFASRSCRTSEAPPRKSFAPPLPATLTGAASACSSSRAHNMAKGKDLSLTYFLYIYIYLLNV